MEKIRKCIIGGIEYWHTEALRLRAENTDLRNANQILRDALEAERAELAKANALLLTYGWHRDECAFLEVCDDCDCGFEAILRNALTINKAARKVKENNP